MQSMVTDMSVQGTILVLDGTSTNRIMLKVQLTAAWYHVVQGERLQGLAGLLRRSPKIVVSPGTTSVAHLEENVRAWALV